MQIEPSTKPSSAFAFMPPSRVAKSSVSGEVLKRPELLFPGLLTEDLALQRDMVLNSGIADDQERAELYYGREVRSDISAFKEANPSAILTDFLAWRASEGLLVEALSGEWLSQSWDQCKPCKASEQAAKLFEAEREAEMALHYLENIEGTQLLLQFFRVLLASAVEELSVPAGASEPAKLRTLRETAAAAARAAFQDALGVDAAAAVVGDAAEFPEEDKLQAVVTAVEALESATRLATSLRLKLPGAAETLLEELLSEGEVTITSFAQRNIIEQLFERSRALSRAQGREGFDGKGIFECVPLAKEFILLLQPSPSDCGEEQSACIKRMYAEVRQRHLRLALCRAFPLYL